jgi:hypothetical protein
MKDIKITCGASQNLGRCYNSQQYILSAFEEISTEDIQQLRKDRLLGYGQGMQIGQQIISENKWMVVVTDYIDSSD